MIITTDPSKRTSLKSGFTVVELLVAIAIGSAFLGVAASCLNMVGRSYVSVGNYVDMNASSRRALENFATDVRMAVDVIDSDNDRLSFWMYNSSYALIEVVYWYDSSTDALYRNYGGKVSTMLEGVEQFDFEYYDLTHSTTGNPISVKEVEVNASLKKRVLSLTNTNEIISARFMMRNRQVSN